MSTRRVETLRFFCDMWEGSGPEAVRCSSRAVGESLPEGWTEVTREKGPCGLTDYYHTATYHYCPAHAHHTDSTEEGG